VHRDGPRRWCGDFKRKRGNAAGSRPRESSPRSDHAFVAPSYVAFLNQRSTDTIWPYSFSERPRCFWTTSVAALSTTFPSTGCFR
jgi:hypothetical protein